MPVEEYIPKGSLKSGVFPTIENGIFTVPSNTNAVIEKFFVRNASKSTITISATRAGVRHEIILLPGYSLDFLNEGEVLRMSAGEFINASCSESGAAQFYIEGYYETV